MKSATRILFGYITRDNARARAKGDASVIADKLTVEQWPIDRLIELRAAIARFPGASSISPGVAILRGSET